MTRPMLLTAFAALMLTAAPARANESYADFLNQQAAEGEQWRMQYELDQTKNDQWMIELEQARQQQEIENLRREPPRY